MRTALVSDAFDALKLEHQAVAHPVLPLNAHITLNGPAFTVRYEVVASAPVERYGGLLTALEELPAGHVWVGCGGMESHAGMWGELLTNTAQAKGAAGAIVDGLCRDVAAVRQLDLPVFATGSSPLDIHGRLEVVATQCAVTLFGLPVNPGDQILADLDGVAVVPAANWPDVLEFISSKDFGENQFRDAVRAGMSPIAAYSTYGVL